MRPLRVAVALTFGPTHLAPALADMARLRAQLHVHTVYSDRFVDLIAKGFNCAIQVAYLSNSELVARGMGPLCGKLVASLACGAANGAPEAVRA